MNTSETVFQKIKSLTRLDRCYHEDAYLFVLSALEFAISKLSEPRHLNGKELLNAIREYGLQQYGPMTLTVLEFWGIHKTEDFGVMVFNLIDAGILRKTETDSLDDFKNVFDLKEAFKGNYN